MVAMARGRWTLLVALAVGMAADGAQADVYVDDGAPPGNTACTQQAPCNTINKALLVVGQRDGVQVAAGKYVENVKTFGSLEFVGAGPGPPGTTPDPTKYTYLQGASG